MKNLVLILALVLGMSLSAQTEPEFNGPFVRVYGLQGEKIGKGKILSFSDSRLQLKRNNRIKEFSIKNIGSIKTKRSAKSNLLIGAAIGAVAGGIAGADSADPDSWIFGYTATEGALGGAIIGGGAGTVVGGITALFKNPETFEINGDPVKWKEFTSTILKL